MLFLSYNHSDADYVLRIEKDLAARGLSTFLDHKNLTAGLPWPSALEQGLDSASAVAVFLGPSGFGAWQKREVYFALDKQVVTERANGRYPVVPVLLPGAEPGAGFLFLNSWIDLRDAAKYEVGIQQLASVIQQPESPQGIENIAEMFCPYLGLRSFHEEDAGLFFGRELFVEQLVEAAALPFVIVVGASGSGKSSVVRAGLIPRLRRSRPPNLTWDVATLTPTAHPWNSLAAALVPFLDPQLSETSMLEEAGHLARTLESGNTPLSIVCRRILEKSRGTDRLLLVVDQFEELFTLAPSTERKSFIEGLMEVANDAPVTVIATLRADFYGRALQENRALSDAMPRGQINLGPPTDDELRRMIEQPAHRVGLRFEPGLVEILLREVGSGPAKLALLEHTLTALFEKRAGRELTHAGYTAIGGVQKSIGVRADQVFRGLPQTKQPLVRPLFTRLVRVAAANEEGTDSRQRAFKDDLSAEAWGVAESFAAYPNRLLVMGQDPESGRETVEVAHEALIRNWDQLKKWIDEDREFLIWRQRLAGYVDTWEKTERRDKSTLLRGRNLSEAWAWRAHKRDLFSKAETAFVRASRRASFRSRALKLVTLAFVTLLAMIGGSAWLFFRSDHYVVLSILESAPYHQIARADSAHAALSYLAALGFLNHPGELDLLNSSFRPSWPERFAERTQRLFQPHRTPLSGLANDAPAVVRQAMVIAGWDSAAIQSADTVFQTYRLCAYARLAEAFGVIGDQQRAILFLNKAQLFDSTDRLTTSYEEEANAACLVRAAVSAQDRAAYLSSLGFVARRARQSYSHAGNTLLAIAELLRRSNWDVEMAALADSLILWTKSPEQTGFDAAMASLVLAFVADSAYQKAQRLVRSIPNEYQRTVIFELTDSLIASGNLTTAADAIQRLYEHERGEPMNRLTLELGKRGDTDRVKTLVTLVSEHWRGPLYVNALLAAGKFQEARVQMRNGHSPAIASVAVSLARDSLIDRALGVSALLPDTLERLKLRREIVRELTHTGRVALAEALAARFWPDSGSERSSVFRELSLGWLANGRVDHARRVARYASSDSQNGLVDAIGGVVPSFMPDSAFLNELGALMDGFETLIRTGSQREANDILEFVDEKLRDVVADSSRSHGALSVSRRLAQMNRIRQADKISSRHCVPNDRLRAQAAILTAYAIRRNPKLADNLKNGAGIEDLFPYLRNAAVAKAEVLNERF